MQIEKTKPVERNNGATEIERIACSRTAGLRFFNRETGEVRLVRCKCYNCEFCGKRKVQRLFSAVERYFSRFSYVRMWTFTASNAGLSKESHAKLMQKSWQRFWKEFRRSKFLTDETKAVKYFRVVELHESGYVHYHVLVTGWMKWEFVQNLWNWSLAKTLGISSVNAERYGSVNVRASHSAKSAAGYVAKYVIKSIKDRMRTNMRKWSRSEKTALFDAPAARVEGEKWELHRVDNLASEAYSLYLSEFRISTRENSNEQLVIFEIAADASDLTEFWAQILAISD